jgi:hypothetical protein
MQLLERISGALTVSKLHAVIIPICIVSGLINPATMWSLSEVQHWKWQTDTSTMYQGPGWICTSMNNAYLKINYSCFLCLEDLLKLSDLFPECLQSNKKLLSASHWTHKLSCWIKSKDSRAFNLCVNPNELYSQGKLEPHKSWMENWDQRNKVTSNSQCPCQFSSVSRHGQTLLFCSAFLTCSCNVSFWEMTSANCFCLSNSFSGLDSFLFTIWSSSSQFWHCLLHTWERQIMTLHGDVSGLNVQITMYEFST